MIKDRITLNEAVSISSWRRRKDMKGKGRAVAPRDAGAGGPSGALLNLTLSGDGIVVAAYTLSIRVGEGETVFPVQVDTGSSDTWIAGKTCSSSPCSSYKGAKYDPSSSSASVDTGKDFDIEYLRGTVSGDIYWDDFLLGPYSIGNQAFAVATTVEDELLSAGFSGLLGLALPLNSKIGQEIPPTSGNQPDGAPIISNLFALGSNYSPTEHFLSILLERPGTTRIPSLLGVGAHPLDIVPDPTRIMYTQVAAYPIGTLYWSLPVTALTVYVDSQPGVIPLGRSKANPNNANPIAILDTGIPFIFTRSDVANAIYGAYGISPAKDGFYYVPCTTPINITISLGMGTYPIHPLDVTYSSSNGQGQNICISAIQANDDLVTADIVLGAAFLRNVYTVMSYNRRGSVALANQTIDENLPEIGLFSITDINQALKEFQTVRVDQQPLSPNGSGSPSPPSPNGSSGTPNVDERSPHGLSVGISVLIGVLSFFGACALIFALRWYVFRRRMVARRGGAVSRSEDLDHHDSRTPIESSALSIEKPGGEGVAAIAVARPRKKQKNKSHTSEEMDAETLRSLRWSEWKQSSQYSRSSSYGGSMMTASTKVGEWTDPDELGELVAPADEGGHSGTGAARVENNSEGNTPHSPTRGRRVMTYPPAAYNAMMPLEAATTDALTNIPILEEITPESLSSRYPGTRPRRHQTQQYHERHHHQYSSSGGSPSSSTDLQEMGLLQRGRSPLRSVTLPESRVRPPTPESPTFTFRDPLLQAQLPDSPDRNERSRSQHYERDSDDIGR